MALAVIVWRAGSGLAAERRQLAPSELPRLDAFFNADLEARRRRTLSSDLPLYDILRANVPPRSIVAVYYSEQNLSEIGYSMQRLGSLLYPTRVGTQVQVRWFRDHTGLPAKRAVYVLDLDPAWPSPEQRKYWKRIAAGNGLALWRGRLGDL
jgi:hypothetical protein